MKVGVREASVPDYFTHLSVFAILYDVKNMLDVKSFVPEFPFERTEVITDKLLKLSKINDSWRKEEKCRL